MKKLKPGTFVQMNLRSKYVKTEPIGYVVDKSGCWLFTGHKMNGGYGVFYDMDTYRYRGAHRVVYEMHRGPIPAGLQLDHLCRVPACVNPDHLEPVTGRVNTLRGLTIPAFNAQKKCCSQCGGPFSFRKNGYHRTCKACDRAGQRRRYHQKKKKAKC